MVDAVNDALRRYPLSTGVWYAYHNPIYAGLACGALLAAGVVPPPELAPAFVVNAALRRARFPVVVAASAALVRLHPALAQVRLSSLLGGTVTAFFGAAAPAPAPAPGPPTLGARVATALRWANPFNPTSGAAMLMDRYGLAYVLCARGASTLSLVGVAAALRYGVDVSALLAMLGLEGDGAAKASGA